MSLAIKLPLEAVDVSRRHVADSTSSKSTGASQIDASREHVVAARILSFAIGGFPKRSRVTYLPGVVYRTCA